MPLTAATITNAIPAARMLYSMAVAADSSSANDETRRRMVRSPEGLLLPVGDCAYAAFAGRKLIQYNFRYKLVDCGWLANRRNGGGAERPLPRLAGQSTPGGL